MKRFRLGAIGAIAALVAASGCETLGRSQRRPVTDMIAGEYEPRAPEGARGEARPSRLAGALSSEASDIEGHLLHRSADPDFR